RVTKASIQPDKDLVLAVENDKIDEKNIGALKDDVEQFDQQCFQEGRDPRWYALASLITPEQLQDQAARNAFRTQLLELYQGDEAAADRALGAVQSIQQDQKAAIIAQLNQNFSHRDLSNLYARTTGTTQLKTSAGTTEEVTENYIEKLSLKDREELAKSFLSVYSPQTAYVVINDYVDQEMDAAAVAAGLSAAAYYDQMADEYLLGGSALTETGLGSSPLFRRLGGQPSGAVQRLQQLSQVRKNFSRFRTLGKTATALRAGGGLLSATPAGMAGAALGGLFALGGDKQTGERIQTIATIGALAAPVVTFITGAISAALPVLGWIGGAILGGGAISSIASALGGFGNLANNTFVRPVISGGPPAVGPLGPNGLPIGAPAGP